MNRSCLKKWKKLSKTKNGYSQSFCPVAEALGFKSEYDLNSNCQSHLINSDDVVNVVEWLFKHSYDIIKLK